MAPLSTFHNLDYEQQAARTEMNSAHSCGSFSGLKKKNARVVVENRKETASMRMGEAFVVNDLPILLNVPGKQQWQACVIVSRAITPVRHSHWAPGDTV